MLTMGLLSACAQTTNGGEGITKQPGNLPEPEGLSKSREGTSLAVDAGERAAAATVRARRGVLAAVASGVGAHDALDWEGRDLEPLNPKSIAMKRACEPGKRITVAAVGDVLVHGRLQRQSMAHEDGFASMWSDMEKWWAKADITYANLEGPTAYGVNRSGKAVKDPGFRFDDVVYTSYSRFNYHPQIIEDLKRSGVDVVSTVNNHSLDRGSLGADRTIEMLDKYGMPYFGTRVVAHAKEDVRDDWHVITEVEGIRIAWVGCTFSTNGLPDYKDQVLFCYENRKEYLDTIKKLAADEENVDVVIATPHWGWEYTQNLRNQQIRLAKDTIEAGAAAVVASHPHVVQKWMTHTAKDGREGFILFSLGNFVSNMDEMDERAAIMLVLGLTQAADGEVFVNGVRHVPIYMYWERERRYAQVIKEGTYKEDAWEHVVELFGTYNELSPGEPFTTTPQCDPRWEAPVEWHPSEGWIGGACAEADQCGVADAVCDAEQPQGFCTLPCETGCPDLKGRKPTVCVSDSPEVLDEPATSGQCRLRCWKDSECRPGYTCGKRMQTGSKRRLQRVCVPADEEPPAEEPTTK
jgi:poly-gamma-glutamate synthesis protein (capsule biosynthesis protein)